MRDDSLRLAGTNNMMTRPGGRETVNIPSYSARTPAYYLARLDPAILASLDTAQLNAIEAVLAEAIPKPAPKLVDLRFVVDLVVSRFYVVLFVGKDRREKPRPYMPAGIARVGNVIAATLLLISANLVISAFLLLGMYLLKSAIGIDFLPGHFSETIKKL